MPSEYSPGWSSAHMTPAQIRKYLANMRKAQKDAEAKLDPEREEAEKHADVRKAEKKLDDAFFS